MELCQGAPNNTINMQHERVELREFGHIV